MTLKKLWILAITPLLVLILAACGSNAASSTTAASGSGEQTTTPAASAAATAGAVGAASDAGAAGAAQTTKLNLNTATEEQLLGTIPNFSQRMVREFMEYRPYISIEQFRREIGKYVDAAQVAAYEQYVYVPIDVDESDAATLQQIPGVDPTIANSLIAGRPYGSNQAFLATLGTSVSPDQLAAAAAYLAD
ncbi:MAG TPA: hypothetical protein VFZ66_09350 [Herpetosiphonaceae bacterium]